jgi:plasmid maintenance system antidote protein VapI
MNRKPTHPGTLLKEDVLVPLGLTITEAATDLVLREKLFQNSSTRNHR